MIALQLNPDVRIIHTTEAEGRSFICVCVNCRRVWAYPEDTDYGRYLIKMSKCFGDGGRMSAIDWCTTCRPDLMEGKGPIPGEVYVSQCPPQLFKQLLPPGLPTPPPRGPAPKRRRSY